jgi:predicted aspartyl protease
MILSEQRTQHITFEVQLAGIKAQALIDCGANQNYISRDTGKKLQQYVQKLPLPYALSMADGRTTGMITEQVQNVPMRIGKHQERISLDITTLPKYDMVLGMAWLFDHNPTIH